MSILADLIQNKGWLIEIEQAPLGVLKFVGQQISEDVVEVEATEHEQGVGGVVVDRSVARASGKWSDTSSRHEVPGVADEVVDVDAAIVAGKPRVAIAARSVWSTFSTARPAAAIFGANRNWAITSGPVPVADASVILASAAAGTIVRTRRHGELALEAVQDVVGVGEKDDDHGARFGHKFWRESLAAEASQ